MTRRELENLCQPLTPEEALDGLRELYDSLDNSPGWVSDRELECLNSAIKVLKAAIKAAR